MYYKLQSYLAQIGGKVSQLSPVSIKCREPANKATYIYISRFNSLAAYLPGPCRTLSSAPEVCSEEYTQVEWCPECQEGRRDTSTVTQEDLTACVIWLHALCYTNTHPLHHQWRFEAPRPQWACFN